MNVERSELHGELQGILFTPAGRRSGWGVVVLGGSSGRVDEARAVRIACEEAVVLAQRWFGGPGQAPAICEIALESFGRAVDRLLAHGCRRIALVGVSRGAEAALLWACRDRRVEAVFAFAPTAWTWGCIYRSAAGDRWIQTASWTLAGTPLPFVSFDEDTYEAVPKTPPVHWLGLHATSLGAAGAGADAALIPIERFKGRLVLIAGGSDALWPSELSARVLGEKATASGGRLEVLLEPLAGHRTLLPGETTARSSLNAHGGADAADAALGERAWAAILESLRA